jgi:GT2 family glycosyltransferase
MDLSIIVVNYNVRELLRQCLQSLRAASNEQQATVEIFVVDNASSDGSVEMVRREFPEVRVITSKENLGFAKANNLAIREASGRYLLFLNPDTVVPEETLPEMIRFMDENPAVGVATCLVELTAGGTDPDCHRGFPTPWASFCFFTKLEKVFPRSRLFGQYHQTWKDFSKTHEIDSCCGAFMMVRRKAMDAVGILDEDFFFYGEDLDWCYRFKEKGWRVMFYPGVKIIHHKGASSGMKKSSESVTTATRESKHRVLRASTEAMRIFYEKHYRQRCPRIVSWLVLGGIKLMEKIRLSRL